MFRTRRSLHTCGAGRLYIGVCCDFGVGSSEESHAPLGCEGTLNELYSCVHCEEGLNREWEWATIG